MSEVKIAAMLDLAQEDADSWKSAGDDLSGFLESNSRDGEEPANVVLEVSYIPEDGDILLRLPGYMSIWLPKWQLEHAIAMAVQKEAGA
jgi:hypothetical protein